MATICTDYAFGHEVCGGFVQTFTEAGGTVDPSQQLWNPLGSTDLGTYVTQLLGFAPDAVFALEVGASVADFLGNWSDFGLKDQIPLIGGKVLMDVSNIRNVPPEQVVGLISSGHWAEGLTPQPPRTSSPHSTRRRGTCPRTTPRPPGLPRSTSRRRSKPPKGTSPTVRRRSRS